MKPRINLAESPLPDGSQLILQEHDGRHYLLVDGQALCGPANQAVDAELARLACAPFRPARQPKILIIGLGLGRTAAAVGAALPQKRATITIAEPNETLASWHQKFLPQSPLVTDSRIKLIPEPGPAGLAPFAGTLHAILIHLDSAPSADRGRTWVEDPRWLARAYEALQPGGLLAIAASRPFRPLARKLHQAGFHVAEHLTPAVPQAKKPRLHPIWLARKPGSSE